jgi:hypothetical protein
LRRNGVEQAFVGTAPDVARTIGRNWPTDDEKVLCDFCWQRGNLTDGTD